MDITINSITIPAVSRNGRIYSTGSSSTNTLIGSAGVGSSGTAEQYWTRTGVMLTPTTADDYVYVSSHTTADEFAIIGQNLSDGGGVCGRADGAGNGVTGIASDGAAVKGEATGSGYGGSFVGSGNSAINAEGTTGPVVSINTDNASLNSVFNLLRLKRNTTGTALAGIGASIDFSIEQASGALSTSGLFASLLTNVSTSITSAFTWSLRNAGAALAEVMRLTGAGELWAKSSGLGTTLFTPLSTLDVIGSQSEEWRLQTGATTTLSINDRSIICDTSSNAVTVNLPNATTCSRRTYIIRRYTGSNNVTIDPYSSQTILGSTGSFSTLDLTNNGEWIMLTSNGSDWYVLASNPNF